MTAMVIFVGVHLVFSGSLSAGILVGFNMLASRVSRPIIDLVTLKTEISKLVQSLQLVSGIVDANTETTARGQKPQLMGQVSFKNVEFGYDDNSKILKDVNIEINPRQIIGITGKSGCGKSTIAKLIQGLYRPQAGIVALDNIDLRLLDLSHVRSQVSLVGTDSYFFPGTIRETISSAMPNSSMDRITWAAKKVFAHEEIESYPDGYETFLEENATNLSTGLRQKIAIARALIRNPRVIILDDAITGFDVESELKLYDALSDISLGRTVIIVSNRLWHLRLCNKIFVLDNGKITQQGSFEELKELPFYQNLVDGDEQAYLERREMAQLEMSISGSAYDGNLLTRDDDGTILLFENPYTNKLYEDETTELYVRRDVERLKDDDSINEVIDRQIREL